MRKKIVVIVGLIIGLSIIVINTIQPTSDINEDTIIVNKRNLEVFYLLLRNLEEGLYLLTRNLEEGFLLTRNPDGRF